MEALVLLVHLSTSGWAYPTDCCGGQDCFEIPAADVTRMNGDKYLIIKTGEVVLAKQSGDGKFHRCTIGGGLFDRTRCLFVPMGDV